ncbi:thioredoxin [Lentisphaerota bacterium WC36G]|nr:thioredoxin [Lentisphaerae bacterium WC36]
MADVLHLNNDNFAEETSTGLSVVDFWAPWCGPCKMLSPILDQIADETDGVKICKVDIDENNEIAANFNVRTIPAVFIIKDGEIVEQFIGVQSKQTILEAIENAK